MFDHFYLQYLVLLTMPPRNITNNTWSYFLYPPVIVRVHTRYIVIIRVCARSYAPAFKVVLVVGVCVCSSH